MKKKMAVKNSNKQRKFSFEFGRATKSGLRLLIALGIFSVVGFVFYQAGSIYKEMWPVKHVAIESKLRFVDKEELSRSVFDFIDEGMWAIDLAKLQHQLREFDWIKNVEIRKVWPDQLVLVIEEHNPQVRFGKNILTQSGTKVLIAKEQVWMTKLPFVEMHNQDEMTAEELKRIWAGYKKYKRQFELVNLDARFLKVDEINNWILEFANELTVNLGRKNHEARVERLVGVYSEIKDKSQIERIDLRYSNGFAVVKKEVDRDLNG